MFTSYFVMMAVTILVALGIWNNDLKIILMVKAQITPESTSQ